MAEPKEPLTERELEVVRLVATGAVNKEVAAQLHISPHTVGVHMRNISTKLEAHSRTEVTMIAVRNGWVDAGPATQATVDGGRSSNGVERDDPTRPAPIAALVQSVATPFEPAVAITPVPVAPNPQLPEPLPVWRRIALIAASLALVVVSIIAVQRPANEATALTGDALLQDGAIGAVTELSPSDTTRWYARASVRTARARAAVAVARGQVYVIGGDVGRLPSAEVLSYDPKRDTWQELSRKPTPVMNTGAAVITNTIYVPGGTVPGELASNQFEAFDLAGGTWSALAPLPGKLAGHAVASFGDDVFVVGGRTATGISGEAYVYDSGTGRWSALSNMPTPRSQLAAIVSDGRLYAVGGYDGRRELATCEYYQINEGKWHACAPMTIPRGGLGLAQVGSMLYAVGGGLTGFVALNERYDAASDKWIPFEMPASRMGDWRNVGVASLPTEFYVIGGSTRGTTMADTFVYEVMNNRTFIPALQTEQENK